ncbi:MAG: tetratricopeptide repeat protein [Planctomycetes bacterium]|nr:tetratricopeptide repeat protein [Planctomycetota bacterium]
MNNATLKPGSGHAARHGRRLSGSARARVVAVLLLSALGCAGPRGSGAGPGAGDHPPLPPGVDAERAYIPLERIEPPVVAPVRPEGLKPLSDRAATQLGTARSLINEQRYTEAAIALEGALRYEPSHPQIHRMLATLHWQAGNLERARTHAARALEVNPDDAGAHYLMGRCLAAAGDRRGAIAAYRTALACSDQDRGPEVSALCRYYLAEALGAEGYLGAALEQYRAFERDAPSLSAIATQPDLVTLLQGSRGSAGEAKSRILEQLGRYSEAADAVAPVVGASSGETALSLRYGELLLKAGRLADSLAVVRGIASDDDRVLRLLSAIHERAGEPERMVEDLRARIAARPHESRLPLYLADRLVELNRVPEARRELQGFLERMPAAVEVRLRLVDLAVRSAAWADALRLCAEGLAQQPNRATAFEDKIVAMRTEGSAVEALVDAGREADAGPAPAAALYLRGILALAAARFDRAETLLGECLAIDAAFTPARVALAEVNLRTYRYDQALAVAARRDPEVAEDHRLEAVLGQIHERLDDLAEAEVHFKAAIQLDRADTRAMFALARLYERSDKALQAQRQLRALLDEDPLHEAARETLAYMYLREGKSDAAMQQFTELSRLATTPMVKARAAALLSQQPRFDAAAYRTTLLKAMNENPPDAATWVAIAESYDETHQSAERYEAFRKAAELDPDNEDAAIGVVASAQALLRFEEAAERLRALLPRRPNRHEWRRVLIDLYWTIQDYDAALELARRMEAREDLDEPVRTRYRLRIADGLRLAGRGSEAIQVLERWRAASQNNPEWTKRLADGYMMEAQPAAAVPLYESLYRADPGEKKLLTDVVEALNGAGAHDRACQYALDWLDEDPDNDQPTALLVYALGGTGRVDDVLELIRTILTQTPHREAFQDQYILRLRLADRHKECIAFIEDLLDEAMALWQRATDHPQRRALEAPTEREIARQPDEPFSAEKLSERVVELRIRLAAEHIAARLYRDAEEMILGWLDAAQDPASRFEYLLALGQCYQQQGDNERSTEVVERALALQPENVSLNNDVAYGWIDHSKRLADAERMIRFTLSRAPREGAYLDTYGWLLYKKGEFAEAKKWLQRAAHERTGSDPVVLDHLGDACWRLGEKDAAVEHWSAAVERVRQMPDDEIRAEDIRRVRDATPQKIETARGGGVPAVAPVAGPAGGSREDEGDARPRKPAE